MARLAPLAELAFEPFADPVNGVPVADFYAPQYVDPVRAEGPATASPWVERRCRSWKAAT